ncbi:MAG: hypothetical protein WBA51_16255 [Erythrobacter sp.]
MTQIVEIDGSDWLDEHRTCDRTALRVIKVKAETTGDLGDDLAERSATIGAMMDDLCQQPEPLAITGSAWSQSDLFASPAIRIDTGLDRAVWEVPPSAFAPGFTGDPARFVFATGGAKLSEIMEFLDQKGLSFRTAGSHKGQSIAGAIATGTHGSLLEETGLERHIRGVLFVNGADNAHWLEDPECPALSPQFVSRFAGATHHDLFKDAVIHLGGMGYCAGVLIEAIPRFGLSWAKQATPLPAGWWDAVQSGDFASAAAGLTGGRAPAFYELTFDPNANLDEDVMQTVYWRDDLPAKDDPTRDSAAAQSEEPEARDTLDILADQLNAFSGAMVSARTSEPEDNDEQDDRADPLGFLNLGFLGLGGPIRLLNIAEMIFDDFRESVAKQPASTSPKSLLALTSDWKPRSVFGIRIDTFNAAICVPVSQLRQTLEIGAQIAPRFRKHFVYTVRFARKSSASMSFLRFETCAIINIDGLTRAGIAGWISHSDEASRAFTDALEDAGVDFSMHWGKDIPSNRAKIAADFQSAAERWKTARETLVPDSLRERLNSPMLRHWGLG